MDLEGMARQIAEEYGLDPDIFVRQIYQESQFNPDAYNPKSKATGLAQILPSTAKQPGYGVEPMSPDLLRDEEANLRFGAQYMRAMLDKYGSYPLALAAYNAGPKAVNDAGGIPDIEETREYVRKILGIEVQGPPTDVQMKLTPMQRGAGIESLPTQRLLPGQPDDMGIMELAMASRPSAPVVMSGESARVPAPAVRDVRTAMERLGSMG